MRGYEYAQFDGARFSVAMTEPVDAILTAHLDKGAMQEDLSFAYWRPSAGRRRFTAIIHEVVLPVEEETILEGNVSFTSGYIARVLDGCPAGSGIALLHSHLGPGWQDMSDDDVIAERDRLAGVVASRTSLPLVGLTWGTDGSWSARFWLRVGRYQYKRCDASTVRVVGKKLRTSHHPTLSPAPVASESQVSTLSVWGNGPQADLGRLRVGVVGLGSVGSIVTEALARTGVGHVTLIDADKVEKRNLDRTLGASTSDVGAAKVAVAERNAHVAATSANFTVDSVCEWVQHDAAYDALLDCDAIISCVDRAWPRHILNVVANAHLIPLIDGGILAKVSGQKLVHVGWRIHTAGPGRSCLYCLDALRHGDVQLDRAGKLSDPDYVLGLTPEERERYAGRNVFAFSLSVAAHEVLQLVGLVTGNPRIGGEGPQTYHGFPGRMDVESATRCNDGCAIESVTALGCDPRR